MLCFPCNNPGPSTQRAWKVLAESTIFDIRPIMNAISAYKNAGPSRFLWKAFLFMVMMHSMSAGFSQSVRDILTKDGLPQSFVSGLVQDDTSFIWIGTRNGLARFDGTQFKLFQHSSSDTTTLASNLIIWIKRDMQNQLWIELESGEIDEMNPVTEKIRHFLKGNDKLSGGVQFVRRGWLVDEDGVFWGIVKGSGLNSYDIREKKIKRYTRENAGFASDTVLAITEIKKSGLWILDANSISLYDKKADRFAHWMIPFKQDFGNFDGVDGIAIDLHERKNGELMWGDRQKLYFFNPEKQSFRSITLPSLSYLGIRWIRSSSDGYDYFENYGQVYRYDDIKGLSSIGKTVKESFGDIKSFLVDRSGLIWLGTNAGGIHQVDLETPFFQSYSYHKNFSVDMLGQELGIDMEKTFKWNSIAQQFSQPSYYFRSVYGPNRRLYLALKQTVCYYDSAQKKCILLPDVPLFAESEKLKVGIRGIAVLPNGFPIVVGYSGDLMFYDSTQKKWQPFIDPSLLRKSFGPLLLPLDILADGQNIWITTEADGLIRINQLTKKITQIKEDRSAGSLPSNQLLGLKADPQHPEYLWIGSYQGLIQFNKNTLTSKIFSLKEGLPDNTIYSLLTDAGGNLWISTNKGICRFNPETHVVRVFHTLHGLPGDEFNRFHHLELPDGRLTFGGTDGWTIFNPSRILNDSFEPVVAITDLKINNQDISRESLHRLLPLPINAVNRLDLPYEQNTVSFGFAGLEYSQPQDLQYRYRLEGYDNDWVTVGNSRQAVYTKIPPGNYLLLVNASNTSGRWSSHIKALHLKIESPWWATKMAYLCYCIIIGGLVWTFIRFRVNRILMLQEINMKERETSQMKELDEMKSRFFSNITHEFRTPLTLIMGPAEQLKSIHAPDRQQTRLSDTILKNAKQLLVLINRLMDLSKLEAKALPLQEQRGNPADSVGSIVHSFETDVESRGLQLSFEDQTGPMEGWFFGDALERIVYNLVSNALKFTETGGRIEVTLMAGAEKLHLIVKDTGIGIPDAQLPYIYNRFYQAGESGLSGEAGNMGTGIGLSLVKELVNQMNGFIRVESRSLAENPLTHGTIFTVDLPFRPEEINRVNLSEDKTDSLSADNPEQNDKIPQILLVEDSVELAGFIEGILSGQYQINHQVNGVLGLETTFSMMPDLIISDVMMPKMDGYEFCRRVKEDFRSSHIPVILLTAKVSQENLMEGLSKGADDYLTKPFHPAELLLRIHNLMDRQNKLREKIRQELSVPDEFHTGQQSLPQDIFMTRLYELLDEHLDDEGFGVDQLVAVMNMSRSSLHRKIKSVTSMTTTEVVRNYRLKKATQFLKEGFNSSDTAYKTGFGSPAYFTKSFREVYGMTPSDYIKSLRSK
jgi:signal transduction histidine kinase/CheY-like chemotaxis protein/ligand-binding sensor domain-containing protein/AraC-like DNA-binding protein